MLASEKGASIHTLDAYRRDLMDIYRYYGRNLQDLSPQDIKIYLESLHDQGLAKSTRNRRLSAIKHFYKFLISEEYLEYDPTLGLRALKTGRTLPKTLEESEVQSLVAHALQDSSPDGIRLWTLLELTYGAGLRVTELLTLTTQQIHQGMKEQPFPKLIIRGKGGKERMVPLSEHSVKAINEYLASRSHFLPKGKGSSYLFPSHGKGGHLTRQGFYKLLSGLGVKAGIDPKQLSPHVLRHAFATHLLHRGADLLLVQKLLGHEDISTTQIYTHIQTKHLIQAVTDHHPLSKIPPSEK